jgi:hypothetical protein
VKVLDSTTVEFVRSTEWPGYPNLNPLDYNVWMEHKQLVCKSQRECFLGDTATKEL